MSQRNRPPQHVRQGQRLAADLAHAVARNDAAEVRRLSDMAIRAAAISEQRRREYLDKHERRK